MREGHDDPLILKSLTMIYPATGWLKIVQYNNKQAATIANLVDQIWLCIYPRPTIITHERQNEFLGQGFKKGLLETEYGIK